MWVRRPREFENWNIVHVCQPLNGPKLIIHEEDGREIDLEKDGGRRTNFHPKISLPLFSISGLSTTCLFLDISSPSLSTWRKITHRLKITWWYKMVKTGERRETRKQEKDMTGNSVCCLEMTERLLVPPQTLIRRDGEKENEKCSLFLNNILRWWWFVIMTQTRDEKKGES